MKFSYVISQLALSTLVAGGVLLGAIASSEACPFSKDKGIEGFSLNSPQLGLNNLDLKQMGLMGAGVLFLGGVAAAGVLSHRSTFPSDHWEVSSFLIPIPPEALETTVALEKDEEYTSIN